jgi:hypothetical protein
VSLAAWQHDDAFPAGGYGLQPAIDELDRRIVSRNDHIGHVKDAVDTSLSSLGVESSCQRIGNYFATMLQRILREHDALAVGGQHKGDMTAGMTGSAKNANARKHFGFSGNQGELRLPQQAFRQKQGGSGVVRAMLLEIVTLRFMEYELCLRKTLDICHVIKM